MSPGAARSSGCQMPPTLAASSSSFSKASIFSTSDFQVTLRFGTGARGVAGGWDGGGAQTAAGAVAGWEKADVGTPASRSTWREAWRESVASESGAGRAWPKAGVPGWSAVRVGTVLDFALIRADLSNEVLEAIGASPFGLELAIPRLPTSPRVQHF